MRVLLAGASGAIGRRLVPLLIAAGHDVVGITRTPGAIARSGAEEVVADVADRAEFMRAISGIRADAVVHQLTALAKPPVTHRDMRATNRLRHEGTSTLIAAMKHVGASRFVAASIFYGYGFRDHGRRAVDETAPFGEPDGVNDSVLGALLGLEQQVRSVDGISLRCGLIYEPDASAISPVPVGWRGILPMLHVEDAAGAVLAALSSEARGEFNIADDSPLTYRARETAIASANGLRAPFPVPDGILRAVAPFGSQLLTRTSIRVSTDKARRELDWSPSFPSLEAALAAKAHPVVTQTPKLAQ